MADSKENTLKRRLEFSEQKRGLLQKRLSSFSVEEDTTLWSFVDLITLLLILFILFYSHAITRKAAAKSDAAVPQQASGTQTQDASLEKLRRQVMQTVSSKDKKDFAVRWDQKRLVMVMGEKIAFNAGDANLLSDFQPTLKQIAGFISSQKGYKVAVAGHTDDVPISTRQFPTNWELSAIRAVNVAKFLVGHGVHPRRVSIQGYSAYRPLQPNSNPQNRQANRRVEITLVKD
ncbi:MAG: OmpA family protein [Deltaproteobacteria bacterium]|nr:OmpA family protein [Deltaproteobacteria bacterium]